MSKSKLIIRLIDIVFILLFAFISVSQIDTIAIIEPPKSAEAADGAPKGTHTIIIGVTKEGTYPVDMGDTVLKNARELRVYLTTQVRQAQNRGEQLGVRIRANWDSPVEYGLAVAKICKGLGIPKGLDVVRFHSN
jgi:biopolymer transport protein ExbD